MSNDFNEKTHEVAEQGKIKCKDCGGLLVYNPGVKNLTCQYCGTQNEIAQVEAFTIDEIDFEAFLANASASSEKMDITVVKCDSCGSSTSLQPNVSADSCPFCGTALVVKGGSASNVIRPKFMLPFTVDKKSGMQKFKDWLHGLWFAPNDLKHFAENDKLKGLYIPYWTYDSNTISQYSGMRGDHYYVTETYTVNGKTQTRSVRKTRWTPASGTVHDAFDDVLIHASHSLPEKLVTDLEPWDLHDLKPFNEQFLTGFIAEQYQTDVKQGFDKAKVRMEVTIRQSAKRDIGGDEQQVLTLNTQYNDVTFKHILLPIWLSAYKYKEKVFRFMINGRTGEVQGERPYSFWKIFFTVVGSLAIIGGGIWAYMHFKG